MDDRSALIPEVFCVDEPVWFIARVYLLIADIKPCSISFVVPEELVDDESVEVLDPAPPGGGPGGACL